jgi:hypothetical protein
MRLSHRFKIKNKQDKRHFMRHRFDVKRLKAYKNNMNFISNSYQKGVNLTIKLNVNPLIKFCKKVAAFLTDIL